MIVGCVMFLVCIIIQSICIMLLNKKYTNLYSDSVQDKVILFTLAEFVTYAKDHTDEKVIINDMTNAVKTCVNKGIYDVDVIDDNKQLDPYESFVQQMIEFVEAMDKE